MESTISNEEQLSYDSSSELLRGHLAAIVESSTDAILSTDLGGKIKSWNHGAERTFGYTKAEMLDQCFSTLMSDADSQKELLDLTVIERGDPVEHYETVCKTKDGSVIDVSVSMSAIRGTNGQIIGASKIIRDITKQKKIEREFARSNEALQQFAYVAAHDLQEPLRTITSYLDLLSEKYADKLDDKARKYINHASNGARRMQQLISDLLVYSRITTKATPFTAVATQHIVDELVESMRSTIRENNVQIQVDALPVVFGDRSQILQLFQNLLVNAIKYRRPDVSPVIKITSQKKTDQYMFCVEDNGIGFDMQYANRIFQLFQRLHGRTEYPGTGIGLAICKRIVERHNGTIWAESTPCVGSSFCFTLPANTIV